MSTAATVWSGHATRRTQRVSGFFGCGMCVRGRRRLARHVPSSGRDPQGRPVRGLRDRSDPVLRVWPGIRAQSAPNHREMRCPRRTGSRRRTGQGGAPTCPPACGLQDSGAPVLSTATPRGGRPEGRTVDRRALKQKYRSGVSKAGAEGWRPRSRQGRYTGRSSSAFLSPHPRSGWESLETIERPFARLSSGNSANKSPTVHPQRLSDWYGQYQLNILQRRHYEEDIGRHAPDAVEHLAHIACPWSDGADIFGADTDF